MAKLCPAYLSVNVLLVELARGLDVVGLQAAHKDGSGRHHPLHQHLQRVLDKYCKIYSSFHHQHLQ